MTHDDLDEPRGRQWVDSGPVDIIVAMLLVQHTGEIFDSRRGSTWSSWAR